MGTGHVDPVDYGEDLAFTIGNEEPLGEFRAEQRHDLTSTLAAG